MNLVDLKWPEVKRYLKRRKDIIIPLGSVEEHGYHLPLSTDTDIALAIVERLSERTGVIAAPPLHYGVCNTTRGYTGTTSVSFDSFRSHLRDVIESLRESGFEEAYLVSGHLGSSHIAAIREACRAVAMKTYFLDISSVSTGDILETKPFHACEAETSLMLHLRPEKVDMRKAVDEKIDVAKYEIGGLRKTRSGVWGSPTKASRDKGQLLLERIVDSFAEFMESRRR